MISLAKSLNCDGWNGRVLLALSVGLLALGVPHAWTRAHLAYDRGALSRGEHWRWITAHIVHMDIRHAALNVFGLALVWALYRASWRTSQWLVIVAVGMVAIDAGLWTLQPQIAWYVGASGVLHAMIAAGVLAQLRTERAIAIVVGVLLCAKLAWEARHGALPFAGDSGPVVLASHRYGVAGGAFAAAAMTVCRRWL